MKYFSLFLFLFLFSCSSIYVINDHDTSVDFTSYKTFAYLKSGIDKAEISDLDKRRILKSIDLELESKGLNKSKNPDLLITFATNAKEKIYINTDYLYSNWHYNPYFFGSMRPYPINKTEGTLYINLIDSKTKKLIWQGKGKGGLSDYIKNRDEKINAFVSEILNNFPPAQG
tara:strand:- start:461 stop:976 length:516 start_codon:yes stop_codon:yes gene_type:complete